MISVNIYQPRKINLDITIPSEWNDLTEPELHFIAKTLLEVDNVENEVRPKILKFLLESRIPHELLFQLSLISDKLIDLLPCLDFIFKKTDLTNLPAPIRFGIKKYMPVSFDAITCGEYEDCEVVVSDFETEPSADQLARLAAILFRPAGVPYMKFRAANNSYAVYNSSKKEKLFKKLKPGHLYSILIWYISCRSMLPRFFNELYRGGKSSKNSKRVFTDTIHAGAGPKNGTRDQIRCTKLYEFLYDCNQEAIKARELQEEYDKIK